MYEISIYRYSNRGRGSLPLPVPTEIVAFFASKDGTDDFAQNYEYQDEDNESYYVVHNNICLDGSIFVLGSTRKAYNI
jgi:hypothetical protein